MTCEDEERRRARTRAPLECRDLVEAPVRIGAAQAMQRRRGERRRFAERRRRACAKNVALHARGRAAQADPGPAPGIVDVVRERDRELVPAHAQLAA